MHAVFKRQLVMSSTNWWPMINPGQMYSVAVMAASIAGNVLVLVRSKVTSNPGGYIKKTSPSSIKFILTSNFHGEEEPKWNGMDTYV
jgi:hypothetical protein